MKRLVKKQVVLQLFHSQCFAIYLFSFILRNYEKKR